MGDHKSKLVDNLGDSNGENAIQDYSAAEFLPATSANEPGSPRLEFLLPIMEVLRAGPAWRQGKMPKEGADLIRTGFASASLMLGAWAFFGSWISAWALIPATLAIIFAPAGIVSRRRRWAFLGLILGMTAFLIVSTWGPIFY